jgi:hypothetical protein
MKRLLNIHLITGIVLLITSILFIGVWRDDEFYEPGLFIKHKPSFYMVFEHPFGQSDYELDKFPIKTQEQYWRYREFVTDQYPGRHNIILILFFIQIPLTFLFGGILPLVRRKFNLIQMAIHFTINATVALFGIAFIFHLDKPPFTILISFLILILDFLTAYLFSKKDQVISPHVLHR